MGRGWLTLLHRRRHRLHIQTYSVGGEFDTWIEFLCICLRSGNNLHAEHGRVPRRQTSAPTSPHSETRVSAALWSRDTAQPWYSATLRA